MTMFLTLKHTTISLFVFGHSYNACVYDWMIISCLRIFQPYKDATFDSEGLQSLDQNFRLYGLWSGRDLYHATPAVTYGFGFCSLMQKTAFYNKQKVLRTYSSLDPHDTNVYNKYKSIQSKGGRDGLWQFLFLKKKVT